MRRRPQTLIAMVRDAVEEWRKRERLSISSVVQCIVEVHERLGLDVVTDTHFDSDKDTMRRMLTNGERVYRWLDDVTKHKNLLPANFLPSILAALPMDLRIECVNHILQPAALSVRGGSRLTIITSRCDSWAILMMILPAIFFTLCRIQVARLLLSPLKGLMCSAVTSRVHLWHVSSKPRS